MVCFYVGISGGSSKVRVDKLNLVGIIARNGRLLRRQRFPCPPHVPEHPCGSPPPLRPRRIVPAPPPGHRRGADRCRHGASPNPPSFGRAARRRWPRIRAGARAHVARRLAKIPVHPLADEGTGRGRRRADELRAMIMMMIMMTQAFHVWNQ